MKHFSDEGGASGEESEVPVDGFATLRVDTPFGAVSFPVFPGVEARGSASVEPDGAVKIHIIVDAQGGCPRRHMVYSVSRKTDPESVGSLGLLDITLLRDDGAFDDREDCR